MKSRSICPSCKAVLEFDRAVRSVVKCPKCKQEGKVADFEEIDVTVVTNKNQLCNPGKLEFLESDGQWLHEETTVKLLRGINTLGRMSPKSTSSIQLPVTDSFMSRDHAIIEVVVNDRNAFEHRLSDKKSANGTFHNGDRLEAGDVIKLMPGDTVRLGHSTFKFMSEP